MKKTVTVLKNIVFMLAIITLTLALCGCRAETASTAAPTEPVPEASTDMIEVNIPEDQEISSDDLAGDTETEDAAPITGEPQIYVQKDSSLEAEPGVTPDMITGRIFKGYPAELENQVFTGTFRNLTMDGVDADVTTNLLFDWEDIKSIQPGDGIQLYDKLLLVENVLGEDIVGPGLVAINAAYFFRHNPTQYGAGLGWGTTEKDCLFVYDNYYSARTVVENYHINFADSEEFLFSYKRMTVDKDEFVEALTGREFEASCSVGSHLGTLRANADLE